MEGKIKSLLYTILFVTLCATTLVKPSLAHLPTIPHFNPPHASPVVVDLQKCWSSLFSVEHCVVEIYKSVVTSKFENVGPACCKAFSEVDAKCWPKMFPLNPLFPKLLKDGCSRITEAPLAHTLPRIPTIPGFSLPVVDLTKCWSSIFAVKGCVTEIYKSVSTGKFGNVGPMCCKAFVDVDEKCWPQMFPMNPFFPRLLRNQCSRINSAATAPTHN
ncbi:unnamed protein product [Cochlearia groenlandica]